MHGDVHFLQIPTPEDVFSVKSSNSANDGSTADFLAAQVLNVQVPIFTGSAQTDELHVHKLYLSLKLFPH
jgi:predicted component of type VI protein secretion system